MSMVQHEAFVVDEALFKMYEDDVVAEESIVAPLRHDGAASLLDVCHGTTTHVAKDGSCLFSSALLELKRLLCDKSATTAFNLAYGMLSYHSAYALRQQSAAWIEHHANDMYMDLPLRAWIAHETGESVEEYVERMRNPTQWGGVASSSLRSHRSLASPCGCTSPRMRAMITAAASDACGSAG